MPQCPRCQSSEVIKNGRIHNGKQNYKCRSCARQFVLNPEQKRIPPETWALVDRLLLERLPLAGIARVTNISERWLQHYVNEKYAAVEQRIEVKEDKKAR